MTSREWWQNNLSPNQKLKSLKCLLGSSSPTTIKSDNRAFKIYSMSSTFIYYKSVLVSLYAKPSGNKDKCVFLILSVHILMQKSKWKLPQCDGAFYFWVAKSKSDWEETGCSSPDFLCPLKAFFRNL